MYSAEGLSASLLLTHGDWNQYCAIEAISPIIPTGIRESLAAAALAYESRSIATESSALVVALPLSSCLSSSPAAATPLHRVASHLV